MSFSTQQLQITGLILTGGAGRRVDGRDKGLIQWHGKPLVEHVLSRLQPQVGQVLISCNRNVDQYSKYEGTTVIDAYKDFQGPLCGMEAASRVVKTDYLIVVACDTPLLPEDLAPRLLHPLTAQEKVGHQVVYAHDGFRGQYLFAAMRTQCLHSLTGFLDQGHRAVKHWYETQGAVSVDFSDQSDAFTNFNELD